ncbi:MAG: molybdenum cofactor biosynthesis protein B [Gammaproteobacteria bacterium]|nr:molybdenum cofactor biosynthesis protein B [Gammaproteobacteria bacterium]
MGHAAQREFIAVDIAVATISDSRTEETDTAGRGLVEQLQGTGHRLVEKQIIPDDIYRMRALFSRWIADEQVQVIISTGGTGLTGRDSTPEAVRPLFDKEVEGFGEAFRWLSFQEIQTSTVQSRAVAGLANGTIIFCLPGSPGACRLAWEGLIVHQLDVRNRPCNMVELMPRFLEK